MLATEKADRDQQAHVSGRYRSHCRPATGTASRNCHPPTEATMSSMNRNCTQAMALGYTHVVGTPSQNRARKPIQNKI